MTKCRGCGIKLQNISKKDLGYTPNLDNPLCERCFKLKNYNVLTNTGIKIDNDKIIEKINESNSLVFFLMDFINIDEEVINVYKRVKCEKIILLTKTDLIPKNIKIPVLIENIKNIYDINEEIIPCSVIKKNNLQVISMLAINSKKCMFVGFTNAGKSSLINALIGSDITVSKRSNTTQDFITLDVDGVKVIDAPGFLSDVSRDNRLPKNTINPITYQLKKEHHLLIEDKKLFIKDDANLTIYINNEIMVDRRKNKEEVVFDINVPKNCDLVLKGLGFIKFSSNTSINTTYPYYEVRPSIIGGKDE